MSKTYIILPDQHAVSYFNNDRADWASKLIIDVKPDVVVNMGDAADMESLSSYDKGKRSFHGKSYKKDMDAHLDFQERLWEPVRRQKKKMPHRVILEGNHENRIERALDLSPEMQGVIGFSDFQFDRYYDEVIRYDGGLPGIYKRDGILFAHFFPTGVSGRPIGGERPAHMLLAKNGMSTIAAHSHTLDFATRRTVADEYLNGLVVGCYQDFINPWAGPLGKFWQAGIAVLRNVERGHYDFQWISIESLKREYGTTY